MAEDPLFREIRETRGFQSCKYPEGHGFGDVLFRAGNGFFLLHSYAVKAMRRVVEHGQHITL